MKKEKIILFGAGGAGKRLYQKYKEEKIFEVVAFADNYQKGLVDNIPIVRPEEILELEYDAIIITTIAADTIRRQLINLGINRTKILDSGITYSCKARDAFLVKFADEINYRKAEGAVAEAGVFQGEFAKVLNKSFSMRKLYLFDTFEGFDERDINRENKDHLVYKNYDYLKKTSIDMVMSKMIYPGNVVIKKGYVPETFEGIEDKFIFVNLDMDLCAPTMSALEWFWPRITRGGVILIHDYFDITGVFVKLHEGVKQFIEDNHILSLPIGDEISIALIKE